MVIVSASQSIDPGLILSLGHAKDFISKTLESDIRSFLACHSARKEYC